MMTSKNFKKLDKEDVIIFGEMLTEMLDIYVEVNFKDTNKVIRQPYLIEDFQKYYYNRLSVDQIQKCLVASKSKYSKTNCYTIYNSKPVCVQYTMEVVKRIKYKLINNFKSKNTLIELRSMQVQ